jgi:exonuclease SbcC
MIPLSLRISGFLSYSEPVELDFSSFDLACISGANGAGKSSLLDAITWVLFGQARRRDDSLINSHATSAEVVFDFNYEGNTYRVQRTKPVNKTGLLEFYICTSAGEWKALTERSLRETELRIQQTLRMDYDTFINASFFLQGKADQFAQQRPGDRKRILGSILGLEAWEAYREASTERRKLIESDRDSLDGQLAEITAELAEEDERRARLKALKDQLKQAADLRKAREELLGNARRRQAALEESRQRVDLLASQLESARQRLERIQLDLSTRQDERQLYQQQVAGAEQIEAAYQNWQDTRQELERWEAVAANFRQYENQRSAPLMSIESERARLEQERLGLLEKSQQITARQAQLPDLQSQAQSARAGIDQLGARLQERPLKEKELQDLTDRQSAAQAENNRLRPEMAELKERIDRLKETSGADCPLCGQPLNADDRQRLIDSLEAQGKEMGDAFRQNQAFLKEVDQQRAGLRAEIDAFLQLEDQLRAQHRILDQAEDQQKTIQSELEVWQSTSEPRLGEVTKVLEKAKFALAARQELARIDAALKDLGYDAAAHDNVRQAEQAGRASEEQLRLLEKARAALEPLQREIAGLHAQVSATEKEVSKLDAAYQESAAKYAAEAAGMPDLDQVERELFQAQEEENRLRMSVGGAQQQVDILKTLLERKVELNERRESYSLQISRLKSLERAFGKDGVPALLIEQALPEIEAQANEILDRLSDGAMSVRFATLKDYRDKNREDKKETLDIVISDSAGSREYELFSGGEAFRVNFAIRLALSRVLAQRAGARLQTLVIDEGFGSQDVDGRQRLIEAINLVRPDFAKVLVITHLEELKDAFPARIEVEKTLHGSILRVLA